MFTLCDDDVTKGFHLAILLFPLLLFNQNGFKVHLSSAQSPVAIVTKSMEGI